MGGVTWVRVKRSKAKQSEAGDGWLVEGWRVGNVQAAGATNSAGGRGRLDRAAGETRPHGEGG